MTTETLSIARPDGERLSSLEAQVTSLAAAVSETRLDVKSLLAANNSLVGVRSMIFFIMSVLGGVASVFQIASSYVHSK